MACEAVSTGRWDIILAPGRAVKANRGGTGLPFPRRADGETRAGAGDLLERSAERPLPISQIAIVVADIDEALERYHRVLGWGPWNVYEHRPPSLHDTFLRGKPTEYTMIGAETHVGQIVVELLQPCECPSIYKEWLEDRGEGLHHIAVMRPTSGESEKTRCHFADAGANVLMDRIGDSIHFYYVDTQPLLKVIFESGTGHAVDLKPVRTYPR